MGTIIIIYASADYELRSVQPTSFTVHVAHSHICFNKPKMGPN